MGRLLGLLNAAGGEASNSSALFQWRLAVSAFLDDPDTVNIHGLSDFTKFTATFAAGDTSTYEYRVE